MLFSPLNMRAPRKMMPNKRQQKARLSNIMCALFSTLGFIVFWVGFKLRPKTVVIVKHPKSKLETFQRPQPHLLASHATVEQVDAYVNSTKSLGSLKYDETASCNDKGCCEIHFPYAELDTNPQIDLTKANSNPQQSHYAVLTRKGFKAFVTSVSANQDRVFVVAPLEVERESSIPIGPDDFLMGLFDGHGPVGHGTSHFAAMELPPLLLRNMQRRKKYIHAQRATDGIRNALQDTFTHLDENIPFLETSGSTGILILRIGTSLFLANTGDSLAFLVKAEFPSLNTDDPPQVSIVRSTVPHKPDDPVEGARIRASGGQVIPKQTLDTSSRVVIPIPGDSEETMQDGMMMTLALAMSRSLGDPEGKKANVIIADPTVDVVDLEELSYNSPAAKYFMVVASDGLLDKIPPLAVADRIAKSFYQEKPAKPLVACQELILKASQLWMAEDEMGYRDDISIAVKMIDL